MTALEATEVLKKEVIAAPREFVSPFIDATDSGPALTELLDRQPPSLLKELLTEPTAIAERMLDPAQAARAMGQTSVMLLGASALTGGLLASLSGADILQAAFLLPIALVLAIGAAMGPVAGTAVMAGARIPWQLLAAALTTAVTAGALTMVALVPVAVVLWRINSEWAGPLSVVSAFVISGYVSGRRIRTMLDSLARIVCERTSTPVEGEAVERIKLVGRVALVQLSFTMSLAVWALKVLG